MLNPMKLMKIKGLWDTFSTAHPQFLSFLQAVYPKNLKTDTVLDITVTAPDGKPLRYRMTLTADDMALAAEIAELAKQK